MSKGTHKPTAAAAQAAAPAAAPAADDLVTRKCSECGTGFRCEAQDPEPRCEPCVQRAAAAAAEAAVLHDAVTPTAQPPAAPAPAAPVVIAAADRTAFDLWIGRVNGKRPGFAYADGVITLRCKDASGARQAVATTLTPAGLAELAEAAHKAATIDRSQLYDIAWQLDHYGTGIPTSRFGFKVSHSVAAADPTAAPKTRKTKTIETPKELSELDKAAAARDAARTAIVDRYAAVDAARKALSLAELALADIPALEKDAEAAQERFDTLLRTEAERKVAADKAAEAARLAAAKADVDKISKLEKKLAKLAKLQADLAAHLNDVKTVAATMTPAVADPTGQPVNGQVL